MAHAAAQLKKARSEMDQPPDLKALEKARERRRRSRERAERKRKVVHQIHPSPPTPRDQSVLYWSLAAVSSSSSHVTSSFETKRIFNSVLFKELYTSSCHFVYILVKISISIFIILWWSRESGESCGWVRSWHPENCWEIQCDGTCSRIFFPGKKARSRCSKLLCNQNIFFYVHTTS